MAHLFVVLERTYRGVHPGSAIALCLARDVASALGATLTAICFGESSEHDGFVSDAAGRFGADQLFFVGDEGFVELARRLQPRSIFAPATAFGYSVVSTLGASEAEVRVATERPDPVVPFPTHVLVVPATCPWHDMQGTPESEYESSAKTVAIDPSLAAGPSAGGVYFVSSGTLDERSEAELALLQAQRLTAGQSLSGADKILVIGALSESAEQEWNPRSTKIWIPGTEELAEGTSVHRAHWTILGKTDEAIRKLHARPWREILS